MSAPLEKLILKKCVEVGKQIMKAQDNMSVLSCMVNALPVPEGTPGQDNVANLAVAYQTLSTVLEQVIDIEQFVVSLTE